MKEFIPWIAVVEDDAPIRRALLRLMRAAGVEAQAFASGAAFLDVVQTCKPYCVVLDLHMPGMPGFEVLARLAQDAPDIQVIITTGHYCPAVHRRALLAGSIACLRKPINDQLLLDAIGLAAQPGGHQNATCRI